MTDAPFRLLVLAPEVSAGPATDTLVTMLAGGDPGTAAEVVAWEGGDGLAELREQAPVGVVVDLPGRSPGALAEKVLIRARQPRAAHALRRRRLGVSPWGRRPPQAVLLTDPRAAPLLRHLPDTSVPVWCLVPIGELTDANHAHLSEADLARLLDRVDRFLVEGDDSWDHLLSTLGVGVGRLVPVGEPLVDAAPAHPGDERMAGWRARLGLAAGRPVVVGCGPLVWDGGTDLFVRVAWILRERLGRDAAFVWVGTPGHELELSQLRHDIAHMGLEPHVHLLLGADDGEALWLGDVHVVTSRLPETPGLHLPATARGQALVAWDAPLLRRFTGHDTARLVDFLDMAGLAKSIAEFQNDPKVLELLADPGRRASLGERGAARYRDWHVRPDHAAALARHLRDGP